MRSLDRGQVNGGNDQENKYRRSNQSPACGRRQGSAGSQETQRRYVDEPEHREREHRVAVIPSPSYMGAHLRVAEKRRPYERRREDDSEHQEAYEIGR